MTNEQREAQHAHPIIFFAVHLRLIRYQKLVMLSNKPLTSRKLQLASSEDRHQLHCERNVGPGCVQSEGDETGGPGLFIGHGPAVGEGPIGVRRKG